MNGNQAKTWLVHTTMMTNERIKEIILKEIILFILKIIWIKLF